MRRHFLLGLIVLGTSAFLACSTASKKDSASGQIELFKINYAPAELKKLCDQEILNFKTRVDKLAKMNLALANFENAFLELENAGADFQERLTPLTFLYSVSTSADLRQASQECESQSSQEMVEIFTRKDLYHVLKQAQKATEGKTGSKALVLGTAETRLISETMKGFKLNGLELPDSKLEKFKKIKKEIVELETQFNANLNNNTDTVNMMPEEMLGVPDSVKARFKLLPNGQYQIPTKATYYVSFMENAANPLARKKMLVAYENREALKNTQLLQKAVQLRRQAAHILGFKDWSDYKTYDKMAKSGKTAWDFLQGLKVKLRKSYNHDYQQLLAAKKKEDPKAKELFPWDGAYFYNKLRKEKYSLDEEILREYFPAPHVIAKMFEIYETLLDVKFVNVTNALTWYPGVQLFEVRDNKTKELLAYFYTDLYPRDGKYGHAAAFGIRSGREVNGHYQPPISAIVANLSPGVEGKPSLLSHEDVETLFHEFGHIMHGTLTRVKYASLSGSSVAWDFVEAPSQMLENWIWSPEILRMISQKYDKPTEKMPEDMISKLVDSRKFNLGWMNTRQLIFGIFDLTLHRSQKDVDVTEVYKKTYQELTGMKPLAETHMPANFGHLMGGYDAGYYGYLWANVFAMDMFTRFENGKLLSPEIGRAYRHSILEKGNLVDASVLLEEFLGRKPNTDAFFKYLGVSGK